MKPRPTNLNTVTPAGILPPWTARSRNLVRMARHLPIETLDASFAADFAFKDRGSRFALLKSPHTTPGPDECFGIWARDARPLFRKLLGLEVVYEGLSPERQAQVSGYNAMNYYRSHVEEHFVHNGLNPVPPVEGDCLFWFVAPDVLAIRYRLHNKAVSAVPVRLLWTSEGDESQGFRAEPRPAGFEFRTAHQVGSTAYTVHGELWCETAAIAFDVSGGRLRTAEGLAEIPPGGRQTVRFLFRLAFNEEPLPPWPEDGASDESLARTIAESERAFRAFRPLPRLSAQGRDLALKAIGILRSLRYREVLPGGETLMTIHAGKTGTCATWYWDTGATLPALGLIGERETGRGALTLLTRGIRPDGTPPVTAQHGHYEYSYQMPLLTWGAGHFLAVCPDPALLSDLYDPLARTVRHWLERYRTPWGVVRHPPGMACLDDAKRWQSPDSLRPRPGQPWVEVQGEPMRPAEYAPPDVNAFLVLELRTLEAMAEALGRSSEARRWHEEAEELAAAINRWLIEPETRTYQDRHVNTGAFNGMVHMGSFIPVYAGIAPREVGETLCREYLLSPDHFLTPMPFPVVDRAHPSFRPGGFLFEHPAFPGSLIQQAYWCGRTWIHADTWLLGALWQCGFEREARSLADRILMAASRSESFHECYDSLTGFGNGHPEFMWSAAAVLLILARFYERSPVAAIRRTG